MMHKLGSSSSILLLQEQEWWEVVFCLGSSIAKALLWHCKSHPCCGPMGTVAQPGCAARDNQHRPCHRAELCWVHPRAQGGHKQPHNPPSHSPRGMSRLCKTTWVGAASRRSLRSSDVQDRAHKGCPHGMRDLCQRAAGSWTSASITSRQARSGMCFQPGSYFSTQVSF